MKINLILAYRNLKTYIAEGAKEEQWNKIMVEPYWGTLTEGAPFPMNHMKPVCKMTKEQAKEQFELLDAMDWSSYMKLFEEICSKLHKEDEDTMHVAIYPSTTTMPEGIYGTGVWGNIILNINPQNPNATSWIPFVFAHEYHHAVWGDYWFCKQGGEGLQHTFLENLIIEGEADAFAMSLNRGAVPSWQKGGRAEEERIVWSQMEKILEQNLSPEECASYMFGNKEMGIPENAGYYYAIKLVQTYLKLNKNITVEQLLRINPNEIYQKAKSRIGE